MSGPWEDFGGTDAAGPWQDFDTLAESSDKRVSVIQRKAKTVSDLVPGATLAQPAPKVGPSADDATAFDYVRAPFSGFNSGLAEIAGAPVDMMAWALSKIGLPKHPAPLGGSEFFKGLLEDINAIPAPPDTPAGRGMHYVGEVLGQSAIPAGATLKVASKVISPASRAVPTFADTFLRPIANAPGRALAGEAGAAVGAGVGGDIARENFPDNKLAEVLGQMLGGVSPVLGTVAKNTISGKLVTSTARAAGDAAATVAEKFAKPNPETLAEKTVSKIAGIGQARKRAQGIEAARDFLGQELTPQTETAIQRGEQLANDIPGFRPSIAEASGSPALVRQQAALEARASGKSLDWIVRRREANQDAVGKFADSVAPGQREAPDFILDAARGRLDSLRAGAQQGENAVQQARQRLAENHFPTADRADLGETIRNRLNAERGARREELDQTVADLGLNNVDITTPFTEAARRIAQRFTPRQFDDLSNYPAVLQRIRQAGQPEPAIPPQASSVLGPDGRPIMRPGVPEQPARVSFQDLRDLRTRISDDLVDAVSSASPSKQKVRMLTQLKGEVDRLVDQMAQQADPTLGARYSAFRRAYFDNYIRPFEQGAAFKVREQARGLYKMADEKVADAFFRPDNQNGVSAARQFNEIFNRGGQMDPDAFHSIGAAATDSLRSYAVRDGVLDPDRYAAWLRAHERTLAEFPHLRQQFADIGAADAAYVARQRQFGELQRNIGDTMLDRALQTYARGGQAQNVIDGALKDPRKMEQLVGALRREPEAFGALRRNVWDNALSGDAAGIRAFIENNRPALQRLFTPEHLSNLEKITEARMMIERVPHPQGAAYVPRPGEAIERAFGLSIPGVLNRIRNLTFGKASKEWVAMETAMNMLRGRAAVAMDDAMRTALYDPETARELAGALAPRSTSNYTVEKGARLYEKKFTPAHNVTAKRLQSRLIALGIPLAEQKDDGGR